MEWKTERMGELKLVGFKVVGTRQELSHRAPLAWLELSRRMDEIANRVDPTLFYGAFNEADRSEGIYRYWVATEVSALGGVPEGMAELTIPAQDYALAVCQGGPEAIERSYLELDAAIRAAGRASRPAAYGFERYDVRRQPPTPPYERFDYDIYRPLD